MEKQKIGKTMKKLFLVPFALIALTPAAIKMAPPSIIWGPVPLGSITEDMLTVEETVEETVEIDEAELKCLADNIYHEARGEGVDGQTAVAYVTLNRVDSRRYPNTICDVVWQVTTHYKTKRKTPQFTWTLDGRSDAVKNKDAYAGIVELARRILEGDVTSNIEKALLYHTKAVKPVWSKSKKITKEAVIGEHIFYAYNG